MKVSDLIVYLKRVPNPEKAEVFIGYLTADAELKT